MVYIYVFQRYNYTMVYLLVKIIKYLQHMEKKGNAWNLKYNNIENLF